jgi:alginate O-acetyltransferase complex protein AlgI
VLFNSYVFCLVFLPAALAGWWLLPTTRARLGFLTLASYFFYGWWDWRFVPLMLASTTADFIAGGYIARSGDPARRRACLILLLCFNLGILAVFKYYDFFAGSLNGLGSLLGAEMDLPLLRLVLPVGISFYTFNSISYTIDIYRGVLRPATSILEFSTFVAMFPHLVAGPIVRYADLAPQFSRIPDRPDRAGSLMGCWFFVLGMAKKVLIADLLAAQIVTPLWHQSGLLDAGEAWLAVLAYTLQIYFDFSGYSDMAIGLAFMLGFRFPQNFDAPYQSANIAEFWRRWHMSLSFWLRDYLYIPLGGNQGAPGRTIFNLAIVMFLGGLWHGAAWTFVAWGLYHGALLAGHSVVRRLGWVPRIRPLAVACTFLAVMVGWVFFRATSLAEAWQLLGVMSGLRAGQGGNLALVTTPLAYPVLFVALGIAWFVPDTWRLELPRRPVWGAALALLFVLCLLRFATPSPFLYFQF